MNKRLTPQAPPRRTLKILPKAFKTAIFCPGADRQGHHKSRKNNPLPEGRAEVFLT
jgi:hypothetical protein